MSAAKKHLTLFACLLCPWVSWGAGADVHSFADTAAFQQRHLALDLAADFNAKRLMGTAEITFAAVGAGAATLSLDTRDLLIRSVRLNDEPLAFEVGPHDEILGRELAIYLPDNLTERFTVAIQYETAPSASGLQWLNPRQTAGGTQPFLFSQSQAIHARSWVPIQDTPAARFTYEAVIATPPDLLAVMSADNDPRAKRDGRYQFRMEQPIPSYLLAIAVGDLEFAPIGLRTGVYAEPPVLAAAAAEFADTQAMLEISEELFGPYRWERYDLLVLPPSFPYGGMENPRLSFITPTVLAGDKSLVSLIAHELAHSWSGNLVTNATWEDFWLNEGFTTYLESRITAALFGERRRAMEARLGYEDLLAELAEMEPPLQALKTELRGIDPDLAFSNVPYEKGRLLLVWLEDALGWETLNAFLTEYFDRFAFQSITTDEFLAYLDANLLQHHPGRVSLADVREWVFAPGLPDTTPVPSADVFADIDAARRSWLAGELAAHQLDVDGWATQDWLYFLTNLPQSLMLSQMGELDNAFGFTAETNNEIANVWLQMSIRNQYQPAWPRLEQFLLTVGRNKFLKPLYTELMKASEGAAFARRVFEQARPGYHPVTVMVNSAILYPDGEP